MLYLSLLTITLVTSQPLEREVSHAVAAYLSQLNLAPTRYAVVVTEQVPEGAAVVHWVEASGQDGAVFLFERGLLLQLSSRERQVLIAHEVGHLAPECQKLGRRISQEICADVISLQLVPVDDVVAMLAKSIVLFPYYPSQREFNYRLAVILQYRVASEGLELTTNRYTSLPPQRHDWQDCG